MGVFTSRLSCGTRDYFGWETLPRCLPENDRTYDVRWVVTVEELAKAIHEDAVVSWKMIQSPGRVKFVLGEHEHTPDDFEVLNSTVCRRHAVLFTYRVYVFGKLHKVSLTLHKDPLDYPAKPVGIFVFLPPPDNVAPDTPDAPDAPDALANRLAPNPEDVSPVDQNRSGGRGRARACKRKKTARKRKRKSRCGNTSGRRCSSCTTT